MLYYYFVSAVDGGAPSVGGMGVLTAILLDLSLLRAAWSIPWGYINIHGVPIHIFLIRT